MPTFPELLMAGQSSATGPFTWADIPSQVARWDAHISGSLTLTGSDVDAVADQVSTYDLEYVADEDPNQPVYDASDPIFGDAGSVTHGAASGYLWSQLPNTSQPYTVWGVFAIGTSSAFWDGGSSAPRCGVIEAAAWDESDPVTFYSSSDGTNFLNGQDVFLEPARAVLVIAYFNGASSYIVVDGITVTVDGSTTGTTLLTDLFIRDNGHRWSIAGVVSGEIDSTTRANMLALARTERGVEAAWSPLYLGADAWYRADLGHAYSDTNAMAAVANQGTGAAGSDADLQQGTGGNQPTYDASHATFNGQAVISFDGGDVLYATAGPWWHLPTESSSMSLVAVGRTTSASGLEVLAQSRQFGTVGGPRLQIRAAGACNFSVDESGGVAAISDNGANGTQNAVHVIAGVLTGAVTTTHDSAVCRVDGASSGATTADLDLPVAASSDREWCVGGTATTTGAYTGQLAELIYCKRLLTAAEDALLTTYVNTRYGLALSGVTQ